MRCTVCSRQARGFGCSAKGIPRYHPEYRHFCSLRCLTAYARCLDKTEGTMIDATEMERAADLLDTIRSRMGITIVWVEHIMGVLMRIVDRVIVLDHGEKIFEGAPAQAAINPRVIEVYLGKKKA